LAENSTRNIKTIRDMESVKREFQIRCSHYELEMELLDKQICCTICGKNWFFTEERGYSIKKKVYLAEKDV
jgi:hypothetical protein